VVALVNSNSLVKPGIVLLVSTSQVIHFSISTHIWQIYEPIHESQRKVLSTLDSSEKSKSSNKLSFSKPVSVFMKKTVLDWLFYSVWYATLH